MMVIESWRPRLGSLPQFRLVLGVLLFASVVRFFAYGWVTDYYVTPTYFFSYVDWIKPWPGTWMYVHYAIMGIAALGIASGVLYRASVAVFFVCFTYAELLDKTNYLNHYYFVSLLLALLLVLPAPRQRMPSYAVWALRAQVACVYVFAGIAKLNGDWLLRAEPLRFWLARQGGPLEAPWLPFAASWAGASFDLAVVPALLWRKSRPYAFAVVIAFHLCTWALFNIGLFPWLMIAGASLFFDGTPTEPKPLPPALAVFLVVFVAVQIVLPRDDRFQWKVMLKEKSGVADFTVLDTAGRSYRVAPGEELTTLQARMMAMQPDMIRQYGRHLAERFGAAGIAVQAVYVRSLVATNGRRAEPIVPADENLASQE